jgi:hypothetical protein
MRIILLILFLFSSIYSECKLTEITFKRVDRINGRNITFIYRDTLKVKEWVKFKDKYYVETCSSIRITCDYIKILKYK